MLGGGQSTGSCSVDEELEQHYTEPRYFVPLSVSRDKENPRQSAGSRSVDEELEQRHTESKRTRQPAESHREFKWTTEPCNIHHSPLD